jgi:purine-binding chemotaxis protein CheW
MLIGHELACDRPTVEGGRLMTPSPASATTAAPQTLRSYLLIRLDQELFAVDADLVRAVTRFRPYTPVPGAPQALPGVISVHGAIVPVVELRNLLGLVLRPPSRAARLVLLNIEDNDLALYADAVDDLISIEPATVVQVPPVPDATRTAIISGVTETDGRTTALLDMRALLTILRQAP